MYQHTRSNSYTEREALLDSNITSGSDHYKVFFMATPNVREQFLLLVEC